VPVATDPAHRPLRILLVSDLHYSLPQLDWVVAAAPSYDLVVVAGDTLDFRSTVPLEAQTEVALNYLVLLAAAAPLVVASGNHDLTGPDRDGEQAALWLADPRLAGIPTDGGSLLVGDTLLTVCPWWDGPVGRARVVAQLADDAARRPRHWVWVYHWPPSDSTTSWTGSRDYGDKDVRGWIDEFRPDIVLAGHVHESPFRPDGSWADRIGDTWVFNAGHQIGSVPVHIELDLDNGWARWASVLGAEEVDLSAPTAPGRTVF
jgi:Icc-related predicted phosphoesterase